MSWKAPFHDVQEQDIVENPFPRRIGTRPREKSKFKFNAFTFRDVWQGDVEESWNNNCYLTFSQRAPYHTSGKVNALNLNLDFLQRLVPLRRGKGLSAT